MTAGVYSTDPPLGVEYDIKYYRVECTNCLRGGGSRALPPGDGLCAPPSGEVQCGNLLLESDIGGTHPWVSPKITFAAAEQGSLYTVVYLDPYSRGTGSMALIRTVGAPGVWP